MDTKNSDNPTGKSNPYEKTNTDSDEDDNILNKTKSEKNSKKNKNEKKKKDKDKKNTKHNKKKDKNLDSDEMSDDLKNLKKNKFKDKKNQLHKNEKDIDGQNEVKIDKKIEKKLENKKKMEAELLKDKEKKMQKKNEKKEKEIEKDKEIKKYKKASKKTDKTKKIESETENETKLYNADEKNKKTKKIEKPQKSEKSKKTQKTKNHHKLNKFEKIKGNIDINMERESEIESKNEKRNNVEKNQKLNKSKLHKNQKNLKHDIDIENDSVSEKEPVFEKNNNYKKLENSKKSKLNKKQKKIKHENDTESDNIPENVLDIEKSKNEKKSVKLEKKQKKQKNKNFSSDMESEIELEIKSDTEKDKNEKKNKKTKKLKETKIHSEDESENEISGKFDKKSIKLNQKIKKSKLDKKQLNKDVGTDTESEIELKNSHTKKNTKTKEKKKKNNKIKKNHSKKIISDKDLIDKEESIIDSYDDELKKKLKKKKSKKKKLDKVLDDENNEISEKKHKKNKKSQKKKNESRDESDTHDKEDLNNETALETYKEYAPTDQVLWIGIEKTDDLYSHMPLSQPIVRVSLLNGNNSETILKQDQSRNVSTHYEEKVDYILPQQTKPYDMKHNMSTMPYWNDIIVFNENFNYLCRSIHNTILFFEIIDFMEPIIPRAYFYHHTPKPSGWKLIGWSFLKMVSQNDEANTGKIRLQIYRPQHDNFVKINEIFEWYKNGNCKKINCSLYISIKSIKLNYNLQPCLRPKFVYQKEQSTEFKVLKKTESNSDIVRHIGNPNIWEKLSCQPFSIPNCQFANFPSSTFGCFCLRFSRNGLFLAAACQERIGGYLKIFTVPRCKFRSCIFAHNEIIYDIDWNIDSKYIVTCSADYTAKIWDISDVIVTQMCELPHSTYVYVAKFHPLEEKYVITCANDGAIRIWKTNIDIEGVAQLTQEIFQHKSNINSICFNEMERKMYSADSNGIINVWIFNKDVEFERTILIDEIENISINHIEITNNGRKMMIHCKDNILRLIDLRMNVISIRYFGSVTYSLRNRSCITPCGSFLFAGSQDGKYYVWDVASGDSLVIYNELDYSQGVTDVHFHPHDNIVAFCCHPSSQNIVLYKYVSGLAIENCVYDRVNQSVTNVPRLTYKPSDITNSPPEIKHEYIMSPEPGVLSPHAMCRLKIFDNEKNMSNINYAAQNIYKDSSIFRTLGKAGTLKPHNILSRNALVKLEVQEEKPIKTIIKNIGKTTKYKQAKVLHPYNASRSDEISLKNGDFVQVMYQDTPTWWLGENSNGYQGFFPSNYVSIIDER